MIVAKIIVGMFVVFMVIGSIFMTAQLLGVIGSPEGRSFTGNAVRETFLKDIRERGFSKVARLYFVSSTVQNAVIFAAVYYVIGQVVAITLMVLSYSCILATILKLYQMSKGKVA